MHSYTYLLCMFFINSYIYLLYFLTYILIHIFFYFICTFLYISFIFFMYILIHIFYTFYIHSYAYLYIHSCTYPLYFLYTFLDNFSSRTITILLFVTSWEHVSVIAFYFLCSSCLEFSDGLGNITDVLDNDLEVNVFYFELRKHLRADQIVQLVKC